MYYYYLFYYKYYSTLTVRINEKNDIMYELKQTEMKTFYVLIVDVFIVCVVITLFIIVDAKLIVGALFERIVLKKLIFSNL